MLKISLILTAFSALACASEQGTHPHEMSVVHHRSAARQEEAAAQTHAEQYDPAATRESNICGRATTSSPATSSGPPCWTSRSNPTAQHVEDAARHRELAAKHRAAAAALLQAEQRSCAGIDDDDRDMSPFSHREDIVSVEPVTIRPSSYGTHSPARIIGATVVFRAVPGLTAEWLELTVKCHMARAAALGHDVPEMPYCPLVLNAVHAAVSSAGDGFAVRLTSEDAQVAQEILRRAQGSRDAPTARPDDTSR